MLLNKIDLNRLRVFYYSCALKSFALVAKELNVSRSAISQSLKSLEGEVGISLFVQKHREIIPSEAGKILFESIEPLFATINGTLEQLKIAKQTLRQATHWRSQSAWLPPTRKCYLAV